jgi:pyruvate kinase
VRKLLNQAKSKTKIIVKVEKKEAVLNLEEIAQASDALMVARGDLGIEAGAAQVPIIQSKMIKLARNLNRPVIVATQMLESMIENPRPTRAEASDVANAVMKQADAVMLSGESASGKYPVEAVSIMGEIIRTVEANLDTTQYIKVNWESLTGDDLESVSIGAAASSLAWRIGAKLIIVATSYGKTARSVVSFRPAMQVVAITHDELAMRQNTLLWGTHSFSASVQKDPNKFWDQILKTIKQAGYYQKGDKIVLVGGSQIGVPGSTDMIRVVKA